MQLVRNQDLYEGISSFKGKMYFLFLPVEKSLVASCKLQLIFWINFDFCLRMPASELRAKQPAVELSTNLREVAQCPEGLLLFEGLSKERVPK